MNPQRELYSSSQRQSSACCHLHVLSPWIVASHPHGAHSFLSNWQYVALCNSPTSAYVGTFSVSPTRHWLDGVFHLRELVIRVHELCSANHNVSDGVLHSAHPLDLPTLRAQLLLQQVHLFAEVPCRLVRFRATLVSSQLLITSQHVTSFRLSLMTTQTTSSVVTSLQSTHTSVSSDNGMCQSLVLGSLTLAALTASYPATRHRCFARLNCLYFAKYVCAKIGLLFARRTVTLLYRSWINPQTWAAQIELLSFCLLLQIGL